MFVYFASKQVTDITMRTIATTIITRVRNPKGTVMAAAQGKIQKSDRRTNSVQSWDWHR
jgi:hypothetical protein